MFFADFDDFADCANWMLIYFDWRDVSVSVLLNQHLNLNFQLGTFRWNTDQSSLACRLVCYRIRSDFIHLQRCH